MGLKFFGSVLSHVLYKGLIFVTLHLSGEEVSLMERLLIIRNFELVSKHDFMS